MKVAAPKRVSGTVEQLMPFWCHRFAIRFDDLIRSGEVTGYAELARLGHVSRARLSQITSLLSLAPDLQEKVLFLPRTLKGRDPIQLRHLLSISAVSDWCRQRVRWKALSH
jgi:hypothetical protein